MPYLVKAAATPLVAGDLVGMSRRRRRTIDFRRALGIRVQAIATWSGYRVMPGGFARRERGSMLRTPR